MSMFNVEKKTKTKKTKKIVAKVEKKLGLVFDLEE